MVSCPAKTCPVLLRAHPQEAPLQQKVLQDSWNERGALTAAKGDKPMQNDKLKRKWKRKPHKSTHVALQSKPVGLVRQSREGQLHTHDTTTTPPSTTAMTLMTNLDNVDVVFPIA